MSCHIQSEDTLKATAEIGEALTFQPMGIQAEKTGVFLLLPYGVENPTVTVQLRIVHKKMWIKHVQHSWTKYSLGAST